MELSSWNSVNLFGILFLGVSVFLITSILSYCSLENHFKDVFLRFLDLFLSGICDEGYTSQGSCCEPCAAGKYKNQTGNQACTDCPAGTYTSATGRSQCSPCPGGMYSPQPGLTGCLSCSGIVVGGGTDCGKIHFSLLKFLQKLLILYLCIIYLLCDILDECGAMNPCQNGGTCVDGDGSYSCLCVHFQYDGQHCENSKC